MKQIVIFLIALIAIIISFTSKNKAFVLAPIVQGAIQYFPNDVGDKWTYKLNGRGNPDTIIVEIIGQGILPNGDSAKIWNYTFQHASNPFATYWVTYINNLAIMYNEPIPRVNRMPQEYMRYFFPLQVQVLRIGSDGKPLNDAYQLVEELQKAVSKGSISVPAGTFEDVYKLSNVYSLFPSYSINETIYFKEHVGVIKFIQNNHDTGLAFFGNGLWELVSYSLH